LSSFPNFKKKTTGVFSKIITKYKLEKKHTAALLRGGLYYNAGSFYKPIIEIFLKKIFKNNIFSKKANKQNLES